MRGRQIALAAALAAGVILLFYSVYIGVMIGSAWYGSQANFQWHMNNYVVMDAKYAYSVFGLATMVVGGLATGIAMSSFFTFNKTRKHILLLTMAFFVSIFMTGLGFNTLDFMLGSFYWTNMTYPPPVHIFLFGSVDVWNFYFFFFVVPLWASGLLIGGSATYHKCILRPQKAAVAYVAKKNFGAMLNQSPHKVYLAESKVFSRSRRLIKENFDRTN